MKYDFMIILWWYDYSVTNLCAENSSKLKHSLLHGEAGSWDLGHSTTISLQKFLRLKQKYFTSLLQRVIKAVNSSTAEENLTRPADCKILRDIQAGSFRELPNLGWGELLVKKKKSVTQTLVSYPNKVQKSQNLSFDLRIVMGEGEFGEWGRRYFSVWHYILCNAQVDK